MVVKLLQRVVMVEMRVVPKHPKLAAMVVKAMQLVVKEATVPIVVVRPTYRVATVAVVAKRSPALVRQAHLAVRSAVMPPKAAMGATVATELVLALVVPVAWVMGNRSLFPMDFLVLMARFAPFPRQHQPLTIQHPSQHRRLRIQRQSRPKRPHPTPPRHRSSAL